MVKDTVEGTAVGRRPVDLNDKAQLVDSVAVAVVDHRADFEIARWLPDGIAARRDVHDGDAARAKHTRQRGHAELDVVVVVSVRGGGQRDRNEAQSEGDRGYDTVPTEARTGAAPLPRFRCGQRSTRADDDAAPL